VTAEPFLVLRVPGLPITQGSKNPFGGESRSVKLKPWRAAIRTAARQTLGESWAPVDGPVRAVLLFAFPKPASAPVRRRTWPCTRASGDLDKLTRAVFDALSPPAPRKTRKRPDGRPVVPRKPADTWGAWRDDARCVDVRAVKDFTGPSVGMMEPGVVIMLWRVTDEAPPTPPSGLRITPEVDPLHLTTPTQGTPT
jgi:Holliday junction resolvase RusA-like endonuclease